MNKQNEWLLRENETVQLGVNITEPLDPRQISYDIASISHKVVGGFFSPRCELKDTFTYEFTGRVARPRRMKDYWVYISVGEWPYRGDGVVGWGRLKYDQLHLSLHLPTQMAKELFEHLLRWNNAPKDLDPFPAVKNPTGLTGKLWDFSCGLEHFEHGMPHNDKTITFQIASAHF